MRKATFLAGLLVLGCAIHSGAQGWGECASISGNLVGALNCDFSDDVNHWTFTSVMGFWTAETTTGYPTSPSGKAEASDPSSYSFTINSECIAVSGGIDYTMGLYSNTPGGATIGCTTRIEEFVSTDCTGSSTTSPDASFTPQLNQWTPSSTVWTMDPTTQTVRGWIECSADASFTVLFDNMVFVEGTEVPVVLQSFTIR